MSYDLQIFDMGTQVAGSDLSNSQFLPVKITNSSGDGVVSPIATSGEACVGILQNNPSSGQAADVRVLGISQSYAVGAVTAGQILMAVPTGLGVATSSKYGIAVALQSASNGDLFSVLMLQTGKQ